MATKRLAPNGHIIKYCTDVSRDQWNNSTIFRRVQVSLLAKDDNTFDWRICLYGAVKFVLTLRIVIDTRSILFYIAEITFTSLLRELMVTFALHVAFGFFPFHCHNVNKLIFHNGFCLFDVAHKVHIEMFWIMVMFPIINSGMNSRTARTSTKHGKTRAIVVTVIHKWISWIQFWASSANCTPERFL